MTYSHPKESAHAQDAREAKERALGVPDQTLLKVGYHPHETTETEQTAIASQGISFIVTLTKLKPTESGIETRYPRCVGYLLNQEEAIEAVKANAGDINEAGYYPFCVVETLGEGIYPNTISTAWFEWDQDKGGYQEIDGPPKDLEGVCGFSIG